MIRRKPLAPGAHRHGSAEPQKADGGAEARPSDRASVPPEGTDQGACGCAGAGLPLLAEVCGTDDDVLALCVLRFVLAGYCHDRMRYFDAAIDAAACIHGEGFGLALMSRAVAVVRALRAERNGNFRYLPANCSRISEDEQELAEAMQAVRGNDRALIAGAITALSRSSHAPRLMEAVFAFSATAGVSPATGNQGASTSPMTTTLH